MKKKMPILNMCFLSHKLLYAAEIFSHNINNNVAHYVQIYEALIENTLCTMCPI